MKRLCTFISAVICIIYAYAGGTDWYPTMVLEETFGNVSCDSYNPSQIDTSLFDNPQGWEFKDAYAGSHCIIIKKGGSVTLPAMPDLTGNASFYFSIERWFLDGEHEDEDMTPHSLSIANGELSTDKYDPYSSGGAYYIYNAGPDTRLTLTAARNIKIDNLRVFYPATDNGSGPSYEYTVFSHESGLYYAPFDLSLTEYTKQLAYGDDGSHNILVYTLDGSEPTQYSERYKTPIHISETTTVRTATISGSGSLVFDSPRTYTFPQAPVPEIPEATYNVALIRSGTLKSRLLDLDADRIDGLVLSGPINGVDLAYLVSGSGMPGQIRYLDLSDVTFDYDDTLYRTITYAPEGGMGTVSIVNYYFSAENGEGDKTGTGRPGTEVYHIYSNNLAYAFGALPKLERIVLPKCLTTIGAGCCDNSSLVMATLPEGVVEIGSYAFGSNASNVNLPESIRRIGNGALGGIAMSKVDLPNLEELGAHAFAGAKIPEFVFHKNLKEIGESAFAGSMLETVDMPFPPDSIRTATFEDCERLKTVVLGDGVKYIGSKAFLQFTRYGECAMESIVIPESVEEIGYDAFPEPIEKQYPFEGGIRYIGRVAYRAENGITSTSIKEGTVSLAENLFQFNSGLSSISLPESLRIIGNEAFYSTGLTSTPEMPCVERIGNNAFQFCSNLTRVTIPESLKSLGFNVFYGCGAVWRLDYNATDCETEYGVFNFSYNNPNRLEKITIGPNVKRLPAGIYDYSADITDVTLPESVEIIADQAFFYAKGLQTVNVPGKIKSLGGNVFGECSSLRSVTFGDLEEIPVNTFSKCVSLESIDLPDNVKKIGDSAFYNSGLREFKWPAQLESIGTWAFSGTLIEDISLPEGLKHVESSAFNPCPLVKTLYIPSTLEFNDEYNGAFCMFNENMGCVVTCMMPVPAPQVVNWYWNSNNRVSEIRVPADLVETYKNDPAWSALAHMIKAIGDNAVDEIGGTSQAEITDWFDLNGARLSDHTAPGVYIIRRADGSTSKIMVR
ncbi:MAG: leucine-rich repeat protein [Muribaculaceae bacterium]|nr:leucine-rich repeat protein [Muribaculaceae bacterium]